MDLNSLIAENEAVETAPVEAAPAAAETAPVEAAPAETAPAADPFAAFGVDPQELAELAEYAPMLREIRDQAYRQQPEAEAAAPSLDPFGDNFGSELAQLIRQEIQGAVAPLQERAQNEVLSEAENRAIDILKDDAAQNGEFVGGDTSLQIARGFAEQLLPQFQERYGFGPRAAEAALSASASLTRQWESGIGDAAVERYKNQLSTLSNAPAEPNAARIGAEAPGEYTDEMAATQALIARGQFRAA